MHTLSFGVCEQQLRKYWKEGTGLNRCTNTLGGNMQSANTLTGRASVSILMRWTLDQFAFIANTIPTWRRLQPCSKLLRIGLAQIYANLLFCLGVSGERNENSSLLYQNFASDSLKCSHVACELSSLQAFSAPLIVGSSRQTKVWRRTLRICMPRLFPNLLCYKHYKL